MARKKRPIKKRTVKKRPVRAESDKSTKTGTGTKKNLLVMLAAALGVLLLFSLIYAGITKWKTVSPKETTSTSVPKKTETTKTAENKNERKDQGSSEEGNTRRHKKKMDFELQVFSGGKLKATIGPAVFEKLVMKDFQTSWGGKAFGPLLIDVIKEAGISKGETVKVYGSGKHAGVAELELSWEDVASKNNEICLSFTSRGSLKLVAASGDFATREKQVHDVSKIEVSP